MDEMNDDQLHARFSSLRDEDGRSVPGFRPVLNRARTRTDMRTGGRSFRWAAAAASIVLAAALLIAKPWHDRSGQEHATTKTDIVAWQSPTAGLLRTPTQSLLAPAPLLSSVFDGVVNSQLQLKAD